MTVFLLRIGELTFDIVLGGFNGIVVRKIKVLRGLQGAGLPHVSANEVAKLGAAELDRLSLGIAALRLLRRLRRVRGVLGECDWEHLRVRHPAAAADDGVDADPCAASRRPPRNRNGPPDRAREFRPSVMLALATGSPAAAAPPAAS